jgi:hypothetical protein
MINNVQVFIVFLDAEQSSPDEFDPAVIVCRRPEGREKKAGAFADGVTTPDEGDVTSDMSAAVEHNRT